MMSTLATPIGSRPVSATFAHRGPGGPPPPPPPARRAGRKPSGSGGVSLLDASSSKNWQTNIEREREALARLHAMLRAKERPSSARSASASSTRYAGGTAFPMPPTALSKALSLLEANREAQLGAARKFMTGHNRLPQNLYEFTRSASPRATMRRADGLRQPAWR